VASVVTELFDDIDDRHADGGKYSSQGIGDLLDNGLQTDVKSQILLLAVGEQQLLLVLLSFVDGCFGAIAMAIGVSIDVGSWGGSVAASDADWSSGLTS